MRYRRRVARRAGGTRHPAWMVFGGFAAAIAVGTFLLSLPVAAHHGESTDFLDALFTATSAVTVTGLIVLDTPEHYTTFGEVVIMLLFQAGGLGIMTFATLFAVLISRRLGLRARIVAQVESQQLGATDIRRVLRNVVLFSLGCEAVLAVILAVRFIGHYEEAAGRAIFDAVFHAISAFNHAGFSINSDSLMGYNDDPWVVMPMATVIILSGLGFPVVFELVRSWRRPKTWSVLVRITLGMVAILVVLGTVVFAAAEWTNRATMVAPDGNELSGPMKLMAAFFQSVTSRSSGFNTIDTTELRPESWFFTDLLMFIGAGSASPGGGIKVTTFAVLLFVIVAQLRGTSQVNVGRRRIPAGTQRQALTIGLLAIGLVVTGTFVLLATTDHPLDLVLFEVVSGALTVGLSAGITADLGTAGQTMMIILMYLGRIGPVVLGTTLVLRDRDPRYELPEERPIVG